jgi:hypothetical protein
LLVVFFVDSFVDSFVVSLGATVRRRQKSGKIRAAQTLLGSAIRSRLSSSVFLQSPLSV